MRKSFFIHLFGKPPNPTVKGCTVTMVYYFTEIDKIIPHPIYAWMFWIRCLNPGAESFEKVKSFIRLHQTYL
ncbi:MAG: DUF6194 family protein [Bacteroidota bacterium]